ncbi:hypothetical protein IWQ60_000276 [Tieghemiomyces parasiticus]|uniref:Dymeclin n=1 Tax=Tieghemiomyces parasiticus TaxID=78921 RepID=A0A9W8AGH2_9FUNG|nr:hypothetical protein IWQ60_000276 [Tieghemiomyces parasiticus]
MAPPPQSPNDRARKVRVHVPTMGHGGTPSQSKVPFLPNSELRPTLEAGGLGLHTLARPQHARRNGSISVDTSLASSLSSPLDGSAPTPFPAPTVDRLGDKSPPRPGRPRRGLSEIKVLGFPELCVLRDITSSHAYILENFDFWVTGLGNAKFPDLKDGADAQEIRLCTLQSTEELLLNTRRTANLSSLLTHFLIQMRYLATINYETPIPPATCSSLFVVGIICANLLHLRPARQVEEVLNGQRLHASHYTNFLGRLGMEEDGGVKLQAAVKVLADQRSRGEQLLESVVHALTHLNITRHPSGYPFYRLAQRTLAELYSPQLIRSSVQPPPLPVPGQYFLHLTLTKLRHTAADLLHRLVANFINPPLPCPPAASAVYSAYSYLFTSSKATQSTAARNLADAGLLLGLLLIYQPEPAPTSAGEDGLVRILSAVSLQPTGELPDGNLATPAPPVVRRVPSQLPTEGDFRDALAGDWADRGTGLSITTRAGAGPVYRDVMTVLFRDLTSEPGTLLLYTLLTQSPSFTNYVLARTDPDDFVVPLLRTLYQVAEQPTPSYPQYYLWLTTLARLTADATFNQEFQRHTLEPLPWLPDRALKSITLSQLVVLVLVRILQANFTVHRDAFIHECVLAILLNFAPHIVHLPATLVQRLLKVYDMVVRRYLKIAALAADPTSPQQLSHTLHMADFYLYLDTVRVLTRVFRLVLDHHLKHNTQLIYGLLQSKDLFSALQNDTRFGDAVKGINFVIAYFQACIHEARLSTPPTEDEVLRVIEDKGHLARPNAGDANRSPLALRAQFQTPPACLDFYAPYIWSLLVEFCPVSYSGEEAVLLIQFRAEMGTEGN